MRAATVIFTGLVVQVSLGKSLKFDWNANDWQRRPEIKPADERTHLSDAIVSLETCSAVELNPIGNCNKTLEQLKYFLHWAYDHPEQLVTTNTSVCGKTPFKVKTPFAESCSSRHHYGQSESQVTSHRNCN